MQSASLAVENLATYGEASKDCLELFDELLEYPNVGIRVCASFCDRVFEATKQVIVPCGSTQDVICGKASKWESNNTAFCAATDFTVQTAHDSEDKDPCYGSKASLEPVMESESSDETKKSLS